MGGGPNGRSTSSPGRAECSVGSIGSPGASESTPDVSAFGPTERSHISKDANCTPCKIHNL